MTLISGGTLDASNDLVHGFGTASSRGWVSASSVEVDDLEWALAAARRGDESGFAALWRDLHPRLLRYLRSRGDDGAEDLAAETWLQVLRGLERFEGGVAEFRAWLFTIARNRAIDQGRARARRPTVLAADPAEVAGGGPVAPSAEDHVVDNEALDRALELVATLPDAQAEMVALRVVAGLDVAEVARMLGKRPGTVRVGVHRALKTLARTATDSDWTVNRGGEE